MRHYRRHRIIPDYFPLVLRMVAVVVVAAALLAAGVAAGGANPSADSREGNASGPGRADTETRPVDLRQIDGATAARRASTDTWREASCGCRNAHSRRRPRQ